MPKATVATEKIVPCLWFDKEAQEAAAFYASLFPQSSSRLVTTLKNTPSGDCDLVSFELWGQPFMALSGGPLFKINPSISFIVNFDPQFFGSGADAKQQALDKLNSTWNKLIQGGKALMPIDKYFFSERYGWVQDKYGLTWQLILSSTTGQKRPPIVLSLMFTGKNAGKAEEAINFYVSTFPNSKRGESHRYGKDQAPDKEGTLMFADFMVNGAWFAAMDSAHEHGFTYNEALSLSVPCDSQDEIDTYWKKLSAVPEAEQCGWLKDKFGVSWQIVPREMTEMMSTGTPAQIDRVLQAFMPMKKFDVKLLKKAFEGK